MQGLASTGRRGYPGQFQALIFAGLLVVFLGLRAALEPGRPVEELPPSPAEWAGQDRDPIDYDLGRWGSVSIPAGWMTGHFSYRGPRGGGSHTVFQHRASGAALHWDDASHSMLPFDPTRIADPEVRAQAEAIAADLVDGE